MNFQSHSTRTSVTAVVDDIDFARLIASWVLIILLKTCQIELILIAVDAGFKSRPKMEDKGVPQGSISGPVLFMYSIHKEKNCIE